MDAFDVFALIVLMVLIGAAIWLFVIIGRIPGRMAREAGHPQAEAINLLAWFGLLAGGLGWVVALVWARTRSGSDLRGLEARLDAVEAKLANQGDGE